MFQHGNWKVYGLAGATMALSLAITWGMWELVRQRVQSDAAILLGNVMISVLLSALVLMVATAHGRALRLAQEMTTQLRMSEEQFRQLAENIDDIFWLSSPTHDRILYVSPSYEKVWARSRESLYTHPYSWMESVHPDDREAVHRMLEDSSQTGRYDAEYRIMRSDGPLRWIHARAFPIRDTDGKVLRFAGIAEDVTRWKEQERELREAYRKLQEAYKGLIQTEKMAALGRFSVGLAHEIKNPLAIILGWAEFLELRFPRNSPEIRQALEAIKQQMERADRVVRRLLDFSKPSASRRERVDVRQVIAGTLEMMEKRALLQHIEVKRDLPPEEIWVDADRNQMQQVLLNLLMNAMEAMPDGGRIEVTARRLGASNGNGGPSCVIEIRDTGPGIPKEDMAKLFEPFFTTKRDRGGTGLGLSVSRAIVEGYGGTLSIESEEGRGTAAAIALPLAEGGQSDEKDSAGG